MKILAGVVVDGRIITEGDLPDGTEVTVLAEGGEETFQVSAEMEQELLESIAEADRGELVDGFQLLRGLGKTD